MYRSDPSLTYIVHVHAIYKYVSSVGRVVICMYYNYVSVYMTLTGVPAVHVYSLGSIAVHIHDIVCVCVPVYLYIMLFL